MTPRIGLAALLLMLVAVVTPGAAAVPPESPWERSTQQSKKLDAWRVRDALFAEIRSSGGVREVVTSGARETTIEVRPDGPWRWVWQRIAWQEDGSAREVLGLPDDRVCVNLAQGQALQARRARAYSNGQGDWVTGTIQASDLPYSCTSKGADLGWGRYVTEDHNTVDPLARLGGMSGSMEDLHVVNVGDETDPAGVTTRHLWFSFPVFDSPERRVQSEMDLWVDDGLHIVRAELNDLDGGPDIRATFTYGGLSEVGLPEDRGVLAFTPAPPTRQVSGTDRAGDVDTPRPHRWFVPSIDLTRAHVGHDATSDRVLLRFRFADLRRIKPGFVQTINVVGRPGLDLMIVRRANGSTFYNRFAAPLSHYGSYTEPCLGATASVRPARDTLRVSVPTTCITRDLQPARFMISVDGDRSRTAIGWDRLHIGQPLLTS